MTTVRSSNCVSTLSMGGHTLCSRGMRPTQTHTHREVISIMHERYFDTKLFLVNWPQINIVGTNVSPAHPPSLLTPRSQAIPSLLTPLPLSIPSHPLPHSLTFSLPPPPSHPLPPSPSPSLSRFNGVYTYTSYI